MYIWNQTFFTRLLKGIMDARKSKVSSNEINVSSEISGPT